MKTYAEEIKDLARLYNDGKVGYDHAIRSAATIAERHDRDRGWSSVDFEEAVAGREVTQ